MFKLKIKNFFDNWRVLVSLIVRKNKKRVEKIVQTFFFFIFAC